MAGLSAAACLPFAFLFRRPEEACRERRGGNTGPPGAGLGAPALPATVLEGPSGAPAHLGQQVPLDLWLGASQGPGPLLRKARCSYAKPPPQGALQGGWRVEGPSSPGPGTWRASATPPHCPIPLAPRLRHVLQAVRGPGASAVLPWPGPQHPLPSKPLVRTRRAAVPAFSALPTREVPPSLQLKSPDGAAHLASLG